MTSPFRIRRVASIARKEVFHILRDPFTLAMALLLPAILVAIFGLAIEFNMRDVSVAVYDADRSPESRGLLRAFSSSGYFRLKGFAAASETLRELDGDRAKAALIIPPRFGHELGAGREGLTQVLVDGADNSTVGVILGYLRGVQAVAASELLGKPPQPAAIQFRTRFLFNPELNSRWFVVPGLIAVVVAILSILLTAMTVAREWETGSMELLLSTPVHPIEIILGKLAPYIVLDLAAVVFVYLIARAGFEIPFRGSHFVFLIGTLLFISTYLAQGLLISVVTRKQQLAMQFAIVSGLLPTLLLSGFIFPITSMPVFFQYFTSILPAKWFMMISRDVFLKGAGFSELAVPFLALIFLNLFLVSVATRRFKKDVEP
ncbi:MAG: multidrug ABC transporter permease [Bdellovibrionales bacterium GWB1_55_8]|nr:MAG: multidrug ABC transporter permease [Bdellovibrionales bacterium GWB1_55_8]